MSGISSNFKSDNININIIIIIIVNNLIVCRLIVMGIIITVECDYFHAVSVNRIFLFSASTVIVFVYVSIIQVLFFFFFINDKGVSVAEYLKLSSREKSLSRTKMKVIDIYELV